MRFIECALTIKEGIDPDQVSFAIYSALIDVGIPAEPLSHKIRHGSLYCVPDTLNPLKLKYFWFGEDLRS